MTVYSRNQKFTFIRQGNPFFWIPLSLFFAILACFYFWQNRKNELSTRIFHDQSNILHLENEELKAEVEKLKEGIKRDDQLLQANQQQLKQREENLSQITKATSELLSQQKALRH